MKDFFWYELGIEPLNIIVVIPFRIFSKESNSNPTHGGGEGGAIYMDILF